jgi:aminoglycoside 2'-N-acetyltransferase I
VIILDDPKTLLDRALILRVVPAAGLSHTEREAIIALCSRAFEEDYRPFLELFPHPTHVLAYQDGVLASHALWVARLLQQGDGPLLRCAYVEGMATEPAMQRRGLGSAVLGRLAAAIQDYDLGALCTGSVGYYARLGWELWRGTLYARTPGGLEPCVEEGVMILRLPRTPALDLDAPLSVEWRPGEVW